MYNRYKKYHIYISYAHNQQKNDIFQFCEDKKHTQKFIETNSEHFHINENEKYILALI